MGEGGVEVKKFTYHTRYKVQADMKDLIEKSLVIQSNKELTEEEVIEQLIEIHSDEFRAGYTKEQLILDSIKIL